MLPLQMCRFLYVVCVLSLSLLAINGYEHLDEDFQTVIVQGSYNSNYSIDANYIKEVIIRFPVSQSKYPYTVFTWIRHTYFDVPVFVVARQQKQVTSWELPLVVDTKLTTFKYPTTSRTLCHNNMDIIAEAEKNEVQSYQLMFQKELSISISTSSKLPVAVTVRVEEINDFYVDIDQDYTVTVSPTDPRFFYYKFDENADPLSPAVLEVSSEDETCFTVSVQNASCPVADLNRQMVYKGKYQTVDHKGGIIVKKKEFPNGFFIVFVAHGDNYICTRESSVIPRENKNVVKSLNSSTKITFSIKAQLSQNEYVLASVGTLGVILLFYLVFSASTWGFYHWSRMKRDRKRPSEDISMDDVEIDHSPGQSTDEVDTRLASSTLRLSDLAQKDPEYFEKKSFSYLWHVVSIAIFYGIPVVQLVITYQRVVNISGNQDICYYNFLCAHPLFGLSDFNHIYSNIGYGLVGFFFLLITFCRQHYVYHKPRCGIPKHYGLFYAMGVALIMEGILSACYHICPNQSNFQFDTSFMYVMAVLIIVQLYQKRHPDINATAYATFVVLGVAIFAAMVGVLNGHITLWILFIIFHIVLCLYMSFNIYFLSYIKRGMQTVYDGWHEDHQILKAIHPKRKEHFILLVVANIINIVIANLGFVSYFSGSDFATFLLGLLMANAVLYSAVYIIMKLIHHERICLQAALYGILGLATWIGATYFFVNNTSLWTVTPAESRQWNTHCQLLDFYDYHDIWHLLSAPALFFSFMLLLTIDDDLIKTPQANIAVF